jgi:hypothetical protein
MLDDFFIAIKASFGVATSRPMPRFPEYLEIQKKFPRKKFNCIDDLPLFMKSIIVENQNAKEKSFTYLSYFYKNRLTNISLLRVYATLVSFVDDYRGKYPEEYFNEEIIKDYILKLKRKSDHEQLNLEDQISSALEITNGEFLLALFLIHAATRLIARGRDFRIFNYSFFMSLEERMEVGKKICFFKEEDIGLVSDNLGDTYHFWAMFIAGFIYQIVRDEKRISSKIFYFLFKNSSILMHWIRGKIFRSYLYVGVHSEVDKIGFLQGITLAKIL